jgi:signal transduction histidine kinase
MANELGDVVDALPGLVWTADSGGQVEFVNRRWTEYTGVRAEAACGKGIGLSISRSIIESHRGRLWAAPNDGPGATFAFIIPCAAEAPQVMRCV